MIELFSTDRLKMTGVLMPAEYSYPTPHQVDTLTEQATDLRHQDTRQALELSLRAKEIALKIDYQKGLASSLYLISLCHFILADRDDFLEISYQAYSLFKSLGDESGEATVHNLIGNVYNRQDRYTEALAHHQQSLALRRKIGDKIGEAGSLNNIGLVYFDLAQFADAIEYLFQSLDVAETIQRPGEAAYALANIASVFAEMGQPSRALDYYQRSLELNRQTNDRALDGTVLTKLGEIHARLGDYETSIQNLHSGLEIARQIGNVHDEGRALIGLGLSHQEFGQYDQAESTLRSALEMMKRMDDRSSEAEILTALGSNFARQRKHEEAIAHLQQSLAIANKIGADQHSAKIHRLLSGVYEELKNFGPALNHYQLYDQIWQQVHSQETERRIQALVARTEIEKAQRDAEAQRRKSHELSEALDAVQKADSDKARLLQQLEMQAKTLEQLAREDGLTGVANRRWLDVQFSQEFERARRFHHPLSIAMIDLDNFKAVNDTYSHLTGDEVLRRLAKLFRDNCRSVDLVGRYGGEEFTLILVETSLSQALAICQKMCREVEQYAWQSVHPNLQKISVSIGLASNQGKTSPEELLAAADKQLYCAKKRGKNQVCFDENEMDASPSI